MPSHAPLSGADHVNVTAATTPWILRPRARWALVLGVWSVPALLATFETMAFWRLGGADYPLWRAFASEAPAWLVYAIATPAIFALGRRLPLRPPRLWRAIGVHLVAALVTGATYALTALGTSAAFSPRPSNGTVVQQFLGWFLSGLPMMVLAYFGVLGAGYALDFFAEARRRELESARLLAQLAEARLGALRMQLHPHFLFNSLNAVTVLARDGDTPAVVHVLERLSALLREVLRADAGHEIALADEVAFVRRYLEVERVRFGERLQVRYAVDPAVERALVPRFVLQPLVENALRHGISRRREGGRIEIGAHRAGVSDVELWVADDGAGLPDDWDEDDGFGVGLSNTLSRLAELHGGAATLTLRSATTGGVIALVRLPLRASAVPPVDAGLSAVVPPVPVGP